MGNAEAVRENTYVQPATVSDGNGVNSRSTAVVDIHLYERTKTDRSASKFFFCKYLDVVLF